MTAPTHPTLRALRVPDLRSFLVARLFGVMARTGLHAALVWHVYDLTRETLWLGVLGLMEFLPVVPGAFLGGWLADTRERRDVVWWARAASALGAVVLWQGAGGGSGTLALLLACAFGLRVAWSLEFPAAQALLPNLVPREIFPSAVVVSAAVRNLGFVLGPVLAGFLIDAFGVGATYAAAAAGFALSLAALLGVRRRGVEPGGARMGTSAVREGVRFVRGQPAVLGAMSLDMLAVVFADPTVLLAVFAEEILAVGPRGYGLLYGSTALGTLATTLWLLFRQPSTRPGRMLLWAVLVFGSAAVVFGLSRSFPLSVAALVVSGMADQLSQVARSTLIQLSTPDALRGRVNAVNMVFIGASNELGASFTGFLAAAAGSVFAVVAGGAACLATVGTVALRVPELRRWRADAQSESP